MKVFTDRVAFVTGGASGIGLGIVRALLAEGAKVVVADYNPDHLDQARALLRGDNKTHFVQVDVSDRAGLRAAADEAVATFGAIHILVNNAGVAGGGNAADPEFDTWDRVLAINVGGVVNGCKIIVPLIRAAGQGGHVVNTASMAGVVPLPGFGAYSTAKYAVRGLTESLRLELAPEGIGVSCLYPGAVKSALMAVPEGNEDAPDAFTALFWDAMRDAMEPIEMGERVLAAIRENRPHIFTHLEFLEEVKARNRALEAAFPLDQQVPVARARFEANRRETVDRLMALPARD